MYSQITEEIQNDYYQQHFTNNGQRFVAWYLRNIHLRDQNEARDDITDGADDKQIDAIFVDDSKNIIYVMQGKFVSNPTLNAESLREVLASWLRLRDLVRLQEGANYKLQQKLAEVHRALEEEYEVIFELVTTAAFNEEAKRDIDIFQAQMAELTDRDDTPMTLHVVDGDELQRRYACALDQENPIINHTMDLSGATFIPFTHAGTRVVLAAVPLKECVRIPGIRDGSLFQKNVRQALGPNNAVNKGIRNTLYGDKHRDFFFFHNGITAICQQFDLEQNQLKMRGLSVVNGCQSLNTILRSSEQVRKLEDTAVLFRFYEIPQRDRTDRISVNTNSQSAVKPRDMRSNDKRVLQLKKMFEQKYPNGYFMTKRGEQAPADRDKRQVLDLAELGKYMMAWHSQRPNVSYSETRIFDKYFEQLFKRDYRPEDAHAMQVWFAHIQGLWGTDNPMGLNETLLAMKANVMYHHLYAVSMCFAIASNQSERVPSPHACLEMATRHNMLGQIVNIAGVALNSAFDSAKNEPQQQNRVFSPQNWVRTKSCLASINAAIRNYFSMLPAFQQGMETKQKFDAVLKLPTEQFTYRWAAD